MRIKCWHGPGRSTVNAPPARVADHGVARADGDLSPLLAARLSPATLIPTNSSAASPDIAGPGRLLRTLASPIHLFCISLLTSSIAETVIVVDSGFMVD